MSRTSNKSKLECLRVWFKDFEKHSKNLRYNRKKRSNKPKVLYNPNYLDLDI